MSREAKPLGPLLSKGAAFDTEGLVLPRKLPNPVAESREKKDLHREMLWKIKFGSDDPKKCELAKAYAGYANRQRVKEIEEEKAKQMTFEKLLEEQRQRLHSVGKTVSQITDQGESEPSDLTFDLLTTSTSVNTSSSSTFPSKNAEFYEVFSKVRAKSAENSSSVSQSTQKPGQFDLPKLTKSIPETSSSSRTAKAV